MIDSLPLVLFVVAGLVSIASGIWGLSTEIKDIHATNRSVAFTAFMAFGSIFSGIAIIVITCLTFIGYSITY